MIDQGIDSAQRAGWTRDEQPTSEARTRTEYPSAGRGGGQPPRRPRPPREYFARGPVPRAEAVALYARFSDDDQDPLSIDRQLKSGEATARKLQRTVFAVYVDEGETGTVTEGREGYRLLMEDVRAKRIGTVVIEDFSRAHRTRSEGHRFFEELEFEKVELYDKAGKIDRSNVDQRAATAADEIITLKIRTGEGRLLHAERGDNSGRVVYGYELDPRDRGKHVIREDRAVIVREVFRRVLAGETTKAIAADLTGRKEPAPGDSTLLSMSNRRHEVIRLRPWTIGTIHQMVRNKTYKGFIVFGKTKMVPLAFGAKQRKVEPQHPDTWTGNEKPVDRLVIVEAAVWDAVNAMYDRRVMASKLKSPNSCLLTGLVICGACSSKMYARKDARNRTIYRCSRVDAVEKSSCPGHTSVLLERVERAVLSEIEARLLFPPQLAFFRAEYEKRSAALVDRTSGERSLLADQIAKKKKQFFRTTDPDAMAGFDDEDVAELRRSLKSEMKQLEKDLGELAPEPECPAGLRSLNRLEGQLDRLLERLPFRPADEQEVDVALAIRDLVGSATVMPPDGGGASIVRIRIKPILPASDPLEAGAGAAGPKVFQAAIGGTAIDAEEKAAWDESAAVERAARASEWRSMPDEAWSLAEPIITTFDPDGRRLGDDPRKLLDGLLYVLHNRIDYAEVPSRFGTHPEFYQLVVLMRYHFVLDDLLGAWKAGCPQVLLGVDVARLSGGNRSRTRAVAEVLPDLAELRKLERLEADPLKRRRITAVIMRLEGRPIPEIAAKLGCAPKLARTWCAQFEQRGLRWPGKGRQSLLSDEGLAALGRRYMLGEDEQNPGKDLTLERLRDICESEYGVVYRSYKSLFSALMRGGHIQPGNRRRKAD